MTTDSTARVFRSNFNRTLSIVLWAVAAAVSVGIVATGSSAGNSLWLLPTLAAAAAVVWVVLWRPHVRVDADGVTVANVSHSVEIPWPALIHLDVTYSLRVHVPGRAIAVSAAPAPGRMGGAVARRGTAPHGHRNGETVSVGELLTTDSGKAAALIRERWESLRDSGKIVAGEAENYPVRTRLDAVAVATLAVAALLVGASALLVGLQ
ncbi:PH domain-containing protein [Salinibacterium hongtaonis]|uniref:Low molecular weight protein antigen 6 PH domain-containing protein n=1 Tax=Homoserinimonas hongtaonis TaxID=2079791 RepID=A0A2U1T013_9MICO|nr:PH domain-containing protein [Salinibacterium hongtaonis]PWB97188.1 hypothetical protein DF220_04560 [Salinibacterium hongtaonis]